MRAHPAAEGSPFPAPFSLIGRIGVRLLRSLGAIKGEIRRRCSRKLPRNVDSLEVELSGTMIREGGSNEALEVYGAADRGGVKAG
jgi:hypothetical protein